MKKPQDRTIPGQEEKAPLGHMYTNGGGTRAAGEKIVV